MRQFNATISNDGTEINWELSYSPLEGNIMQSHIHVGQAGVNGGISVFLCSNLANGPAGTQACPAGPATISGTITAANVIGNAGGARQGVDAGQTRRTDRGDAGGCDLREHPQHHLARWRSAQPDRRQQQPQPLRKVRRIKGEKGKRQNRRRKAFKDLSP